MCRGLLVLAAVLLVAACATTAPRGRAVPADLESQPPIEIAGMLPPGFDPPVLLHALTPRYPYEAQLRREEGTVQLRAIVGTDGRLFNISVSGGSALLATAVKEAAPTAEFEPARLGGVPIDVWVSIPIKFRLPPPTPEAIPSGGSHLVERWVPPPDETLARSLDRPPAKGLGHR